MDMEEMMERLLARMDEMNTNAKAEADKGLLTRMEVKLDDNQKKAEAFQEKMNSTIQSFWFVV
jgi:hypothetical protein